MKLSREEQRKLHSLMIERPKARECGDAARLKQIDEELAPLKTKIEEVK